VLSKEQQAARFEYRSNAVVHRTQPGDRGEQSERAAARRCEQCRISGRDLTDIVSRDVDDDKNAGLVRIIERRGDACGGRSAFETPCVAGASTVPASA